MKIRSQFLQMVFLCLLLGSQNLQGQSVEDALKTINEASLKGQLGFLASDWMEGRESDTKGAFMASDYIASMFQVFGIQPYGDMEYAFPMSGQRGFKPESKPGYFQKFNIIKYRPSEIQSFSLIKESNGSRVARNFDYGIDYGLTGIESNIEIEAPVVFIGYGVKSDSLKYDDFAKMNVKGKIIARLDGFPGYHDLASPAYKKFKFNSLWSQKEKWAREAGAVGIINLSAFPSKDFGKVTNLPFRYQSGNMEADVAPEKYYDTYAILATDSLQKSLPSIRISARLQNELMSIINIDLYSFENDAKNNLKSASREVPGLKIALKSCVKSELVAVRNVLGMIEGENKNEFVVVGAHYDHIGKYGGYIFNGADDNGSGTVGVLSIARAMKASGKKPQKTIIFAAWTAEEKGLLGSNFFVNNFSGINRIAVNLNFDMIARSTVADTTGNKCGFSFTKAYGGFRELSQKNVKDFGLNLDVKYNPSERPSGGSDYAPFAAKDIPVIAFMAAMHPDYHKATDELDKIQWGKMERIIKLGFLNVYNLANTDLKTLRKD
ncbi:MAG: M20/M25/M40 family metallo-hydrolase [Mariniphaga sp.]